MSERFISAFLLLLLVCDPVGNIRIFISALDLPDACLRCPENVPPSRSCG